MQHMMTKRNKRTLIRSAAIAALAAAAPAWAATYTWDLSNTGPGDATITPGSGTWDFNGSNTVWNTGGTNVGWSNTNFAVFGGGVDAAAGTYNVTLGAAGITVSGITVQNSGYTFSAATPTTVFLPGNNPTISIAAGKLVTVGSGVTFNGGLTALEITGGSATSTMNLETGGVLAGTSFTRLNSGILNVNGGLITTASGSAFAIGGQNLSLSATVNLNSGTISSGASAGSGVRFGTSGYTGAATLNVNGGVLAVNSFTSTGSPIATLNLNGGILQARSSNASYFAMTVATANVQLGGAIIDTNTFSITLAQALTHDPALGVTIDGGLTKISTGTLTMTGASTYTGGTTIAAGNITADLSVNTGGVLPTGTNLRLGGASAGNATNASFTVLGKSTGTSAQTIGSLALASNTANTITLTPNGGSGTTLAINGAWTRGGGSTITFDLSGAGSKTVVPSGLADSTVLGYALVNDGVIGFASVSSGTLVRAVVADSLTSSNGSTSGGIGPNLIMNNGTVTRSANTNFAVNSLEFNVTSNSTLNLNNSTMTISSGGLLWKTTGGALAINSGQLGATDSEVIFYQRNTSQSATIAATVSGGTGSFTKAGTGTVVLTGQNSYTGNTVILSGALQIGANGTTGGIGSSSQVVNYGTLTINRSDNISFTNLISGSGAINKAGSGKLTLGANNTYTGTTSIGAGILEVQTINSVVGGTATSNLGAPITATNGTIQISTSSTAGTLRYVGSGETTDRLVSFASLNTGTAAVANIDASGGGALVFSNTGVWTMSNTNTSAQSTLTLMGTSTAGNLVAGLIEGGNVGSAGGTGVIKAGSGTWTLTNSQNRYTKSTAISAGTLIAGADVINKLTPTGARAGQAFTSADSTTDRITITDNPLVAGDQVIFTNFTGTGAGGISASPTATTTYYVSNVSADTFQLATTLAAVNTGTFVNITGTTLAGNLWQVGAFGASNGAISLGDANTTAGSNPRLLVGTGTSGFTVNRAVTIGGTVSSSSYTIGGATNANNTFAALVTANRDLTVSQVATTGANALSIIGGITGSTVASSGTQTVTFAGPGAINLSTVGITDGSGGGTTKTAVVVSGGTARFTTASTYTGGTSVAGGSLYVNNATGSGTGSGAVGVANGATLGGSGTISGVLTVAGTLTPGNSPGRLTIANDVTLTNAATFAAEVNGQSAGVTYDQLTVDGTHVINLGGATLSVAMGTFGVAEGDRIYLLDNTGAGAITGTFAGLIEGSQIATLDGVNGFNWNITYAATFGDPEGAANDVAIYAASAVPEPAGLGVVALGGFAMLRRRRRNHQAH